jgi:hypothetical protein
MKLLHRYCSVTFSLPSIRRATASGSTLTRAVFLNLLSLIFCLSECIQMRLLGGGGMGPGPYYTYIRLLYRLYHSPTGFKSA